MRITQEQSRQAEVASLAQLTARGAHMKALEEELQTQQAELINLRQQLVRSALGAWLGTPFYMSGGDWQTWQGMLHCSNCYCPAFEARQGPAH